MDKLRRKFSSLFQSSSSSYTLFHDGIGGLLDLPVPVMRLIASYRVPHKAAAAADLANLCFCHSKLAFLKDDLPEIMEIRGESFKESRGCPPFGDLNPELYFWSPVIPREVKSITMIFRWKDQGWGNRKGRLWVELVREGTVMASTLDACHWLLAPHAWEERQVQLSSSKYLVVRLLRPGDRLKFMRSVGGGGGGHELHVSNFCARLHLSKKKRSSKREAAATASLY